MDINTGVTAGQIENLKDEWAALHRRRCDRRTKAYRAERDRIARSLDTLTRRYASLTGMDHAAVLRRFELIGD